MSFSYRPKQQYTSSRPQHPFSGNYTNFHPITSTRKSRGPCQICHYNNHTADRWHRLYENRPHLSPIQANLTTYSSPIPPLYHTPHSGYVQTAPYNSWHPDIGASYHMTPNSQMLSHSLPYGGSDQILVGNSQSLPIENTGTFFCTSKSSNSNLILKNVLHVPQLTKPLLSVHKFTSDTKCFFEF